MAFSDINDCHPNRKPRNPLQLTYVVDVNRNVCEMD